MEGKMAQIATAFWLAGSQAVRLPRDFWFEGHELHIERLGSRIVLTPMPGPSILPKDRPGPTGQHRPRAELMGPPPGVTFAGFLGPRPMAKRSPSETLAEVRGLFAEPAANNNDPIPSTQAPVG
jgi:virulence-associated protein VagC